MIGIWVPVDGNPTAWGDFKQDLPFGILEWDLEERTTSINFLDLSPFLSTHNDTSRLTPSRK